MDVSEEPASGLSSLTEPLSPFILPDLNLCHCRHSRHSRNSSSSSQGSEGKVSTPAIQEEVDEQSADRKHVRTDQGQFTTLQMREWLLKSSISIRFTHSVRRYYTT